MKTIAYYISDYGFGHAARSIAIIRELIERNKEINIIVCNSFALSFLRNSIISDRVTFREIKTDIGYFLKKDSIFPDIKRLQKEYSLFISNWSELTNRERHFLGENNVDLVISDISPIPFDGASSLGINSVGVSNFTWYTAYEGLLDKVELEILKKSYNKMYHFFSLAGSNEPNWTNKKNFYGFISRNVNNQEVKRIRSLLNSGDNKKVIFIGIGMKIDIPLDTLPIWENKDCIFIVSSNVRLKRPNVYSIPKDYVDSQNFIAASDLVISKAGWGTIAEAVNSCVPLLILNRPNMSEDQNTIRYLLERELSEVINWEDFEMFDLSKMTLKNVRKVHPQINQVKQISEELIRMINSR